MSKIARFNKKDNNDMLPVHFDNMLDDFFSDGWYPFRNLAHDTFKMDVQEDEKTYVIEAEMPGVKKEDILLDFNDGRLTICVNHKEELDDENRQYVHRERRVASMKRSVYLMDAASEGIDAKLENGELKVVIPKIKMVDKSHKIEVK